MFLLSNALPRFNSYNYVLFLFLVKDKVPSYFFKRKMLLHIFFRSYLLCRYFFNSSHHPILENLVGFFFLSSHATFMFARKKNQKTACNEIQFGRSFVFQRFKRVTHTLRVFFLLSRNQMFINLHDFVLSFNTGRHYYLKKKWNHNPGKTRKAMNTCFYLKMFSQFFFWSCFSSLSLKRTFCPPGYSMFTLCFRIILCNTRVP